MAAVSVVLHHAAQQLYLQRGDKELLDIFHYRLGSFGVILFFAISGFLMSSLAHRPGVWHFLSHRVLRIYPLFWIATFVTLLENWAVFGNRAVIDPLALGLIPGGPYFYVLGVEWTLPYELSFYVVVFFIMVIRAQRYLPLIGAVWFLSVVLAVFALPHLQGTLGQWPTISYLLLSEKTLPFSAGLLVPFLVRRGWIGPAAPVIAVAFLACSEFRQQWTVLLVALGCTLLVAVAVNPATQVNARENRTLVALGDWSFALYLCHVPIIHLLYGLASPQLSPSVLWATAVGASLLCACALGWFDVRLYRRLKQWSDRSRPPARIAVGCVFLASFLIPACLVDLREHAERREARVVARVGAQVQTAGAQDMNAVAGSLDAVGLTPSHTVQVALDRFAPAEGGGVDIRGWAVDTAAATHLLFLIGFYDGRYVGAIPVDVRRPDVLAYLAISDWTGVTPGFQGVLRVPGCQPDATLVVALLDPGRSYSFLPSPSRPPGC